MRRRAGFSLIELLVVMTLITAVVLIGMPAIQGWLERYRVRSAAESIAASIQLQRMRAISRNSRFSLSFDDADGSYTRYDGEPGSWTEMDGGPRYLPERVSFEAPGGGDAIEPSFGGTDDVLVFHPDGTVNDRLGADDSIFVRSVLGDRFEVIVNKATGRTDVDEIGS